MTQKILGIFSKDPLIWFHYILLVGALFGLHWLGGTLFNLDYKPWYFMVIWYFVGLSLSDQLIRKVIGVD